MKLEKCKCNEIFYKAIDPKLFIGHSIAPPLIGTCSTSTIITIYIT